MARLKKFNLHSKNMWFGIMVITLGLFILCGIIYTSTYALYRLEKKYDIIGSLIGNFTYEFTLNYNNNGGSGCSSKTITFDRSIGELCMPSYPGRAFTFWSDSEGNIIDHNYILDERSNITIYANYTEPTCAFNNNTSFNFDYTGGNQEFTPPCNGTYEIELWGAGGYLAGNGAYTKGTLNLNAGERTFYLYIGGKGGTLTGGYNGGGNSGTYVSSSNLCGVPLNTYNGIGSGGGATDIRLVNGSWNNFNSLKSRIIVAGGGGGSQYGSNYIIGNAGGLIGYDAYEDYASYAYYKSNGGTQTSGGASPVPYNITPTPGTFGAGGNGTASSGAGYGGGGGGGYYGGSGGNGAACGAWNGAGGSSYISGHTGCNSISSSSTSTNISHTGSVNHYSGIVFSNTKMIDGYGREWTTTSSGDTVGMPSTDWSTTINGNPGNGHIRITLKQVVSDYYNIIYNSNGGTICEPKAIKYNEPIGELCTPTKEGYIFDGWYLADGQEMLATTIKNGRSNLNVIAKWVSPNCSVALNSSKTFNFSGAAETYTLPCSGTYKLEVYGAQGGSLSPEQGFHGRGGLGGYSKGDYIASGNTQLFVYVGEQSSDNTLSSFNGGSFGDNGGSYYLASGGGGTDIRTVKNNSYTNRLIVAGGGGGSAYYGNYLAGGTGGGLVGGNIYYTNWANATSVVTSGNHGAGQTYSGAANVDEYSLTPGYSVGYTPGGVGYGAISCGGGWYGGAYYSVSDRIYSGSGGSGYIGGVLNGSSSAGVNEGHGSAKITLTSITPAKKIIYDNNGGSGCLTKALVTGKKYGELCTPEYHGYAFLGWYNGNTLVSADTMYNGSSDITLTARWQNVTKCKRATVLHTEICNPDSPSHGCRLLSYNEGDTITYGNLGKPNVLKAGDAFDCDVNGDGTFNPTNERFYVLMDKNEVVSLIYYANTLSGVANNTSSAISMYDSSGSNWYGPRTARSNLPSTSLWSNVSIINTTRQLRTLQGATKTTGGNLPTASVYSGYAARLVSTEEVQSACKIYIWKAGYNSLSNCLFMLENTKYATGSVSANGYWIEGGNSYDNYSAAFVDAMGFYASYTDATQNTNFGVRPVIEVNKENIAY